MSQVLMNQFEGTTLKHQRQFLNFTFLEFYIIALGEYFNAAYSNCNTWITENNQERLPYHGLVCTWNGSDAVGKAEQTVYTWTLTAWVTACVTGSTVAF